MFLHLGGDCMVKLKDIIAILNAENSVNVQSTIDFLNKAQSEKIIERIDHNDCKSVIITDKKIIYSPISSQTLKKRANFVNTI